MRKLIISLALTGLVFALGASPASAQTQILLGSSTQSVTFTGAGSTVTVTLGSCDAVTCTLSGSATGFGALAGSGPYSITTAASNVITLSSTATPGFYSVAPAGLIFFSWGSGGSLLTGTITLLNFSQTLGAGTFNSTATANLVVTGGSLMSVFPPGGGILQLTIQLPGTASISSLFGSGSIGSTTSGTIQLGSIVPTPEPASMVLLGSGLLALGAGLRRRLRGSQR